MKKLLSIMLLASSMTLGAALSSCDFTIEGDETWNYSADNKEDCEQLVKDFFEKTLANTNQVVTTKNKGTVVSVETIDGTSGYADYRTNGVKSYSFIDGNDYIYGMLTEEGGVYWIDEELYNSGYYFYKVYIDVFQDLPENLSYSCEVKGEGTFSENEENNTSTATLNLRIENGEEGTMVLNATAKNDLVETVNYSYSGTDGSSATTLEFAYGSASITLPDISEWTNGEFQEGPSDEEDDEVVEEPIEE